MWTEDELAKWQKIWADISESTPDNAQSSELFRLARLGLAAEQVRDLLVEPEMMTSAEEKEWDKFVKHPAWRRE